MNIAILWRSYGPYHIARLKALRTLSNLGPVRIYGCEVSDNSKSYAWKADRSSGVSFDTLFPGEVDANVNVIRFGYRFARWLQENDIKILLVPSFWPAYACAAILLGRVLGCGIVLMTDSTDLTSKEGIWRRVLKRLICQLCGAALVSGTRSRAYLLGLGFKPQCIWQGYDVVDNEYFEESASKARGDFGEFNHGSSFAGNYILSLGRFVKKKNLYRVLSAYAIAWRTGKLSGHRLVLVGDGPEKAGLIEHARLLGLTVVIGGNSDRGDGVVVFEPFAQQSMVVKYFAFASFFIIASSSEEWGLVVNEAMSCGVPVIASRSVGCSQDLVVEGETGLTFCHDNDHSLADAISTLCQNRDVRHRFGAAATKHIRGWGLSKFSRSAIAAASASSREAWADAYNGTIIL